MAQQFRFRLETVLRVRDLREREAKRRFGAKQAEIARLDVLDDQTQSEISQTQAALLQSLENARLDPTELSRSRAWVAHLRRTILERQVVRRGLMADLEKLRSEFQQARTARRVIEKLRERRYEEYRRERNLREQADADELALRLHGDGLHDA